MTRFVGKFVLDIMPAALASVIGGFLFTQYHFGHSAPKPVLEQVTPASAEMMALVRDEHAMIIDYLKTQMAAEKSRAAAEDADLARAQEASKAGRREICGQQGGCRGASSSRLWTRSPQPTMRRAGRRGRGDQAGRLAARQAAGGRRRAAAATGAASRRW